MWPWEAVRHVTVLGMRRMRRAFLDLPGDALVSCLLNVLEALLPVIREHGARDSEGESDTHDNCAGQSCSGCDDVQLNPRSWSSPRWGLRWD
jgi:hypothetical protein